jgi:hypothetical protein
VNFAAVDFSFSGVKLGETPADLANAQSASLDGSSTATALASGLAALIHLLVKGEDSGKLLFIKNFF